MNYAEPEMQFVSLRQQAEASKLGMWTFIAQEIMFFGGLFLTYTVMRGTHQHAFMVAQRELSTATGTLNTCVLLLSSFTMTMAIRAAKLGKRGALLIYLSGTALFGLAFLLIKGMEWADDIRKGLLPGQFFNGAHGLTVRADIFYGLYYIMTGLHALHLAIGVLLVGALMGGAAWGKFVAPTDTPNAVEGVGLYWHFVDVVWLFIYPLFYLIH